MDTIRIGIIGGGLAGLTSAIHLASNGFNVKLFEKQGFPHHKVCGEYVSNEVLPYLNALHIDISSVKPKTISKLNWTTTNSKQAEIELPLGGFGISRYAFDQILAKKAVSVGVKLIQDSVSDIQFENETFSVILKDNMPLHFDYVIGAYGKRSNIDKTLNRNFIQNKTKWMAVKAHYTNSTFPEDTVQLHNFDGGYCGLSKVETDAVNLCYLTTYESFQKYKDIDDFNAEVLSQNPFLDDFLSNSQMRFEKPLTIAQISFEDKPTVENHILMVGDSAGLIHPLCGNGMAMAIHSAKLVSETLIEAISQNWKRTDLEDAYSKRWQHNFSKRLKSGAILQKVLLSPTISKAAVNSVAKSAWLLKQIIKTTHGKPLSV